MQGWRSCNLHVTVQAHLYGHMQVAAAPTLPFKLMNSEVLLLARGRAVDVLLTCCYCAYRLQRRRPSKTAFPGTGWAGTERDRGGGW
jgi:hypothetical protein